MPPGTTLIPAMPQRKSKIASPSGKAFRSPTERGRDLDDHLEKLRGLWHQQPFSGYVVRLPRYPGGKPKPAARKKRNRLRGVMRIQKRLQATVSFINENLVAGLYRRADSADE